MSINRKVYIIHTGISIKGEGDTPNWSKYKTIATSAEKAIKNVKKKLRNKSGTREYIESVELVTVLD